jgi:hypothetical protein
LLTQKNINNDPVERIVELERDANGQSLLVSLRRERDAAPVVERWTRNGGGGWNTSRSQDAPKVFGKRPTFVYQQQGGTTATPETTCTISVSNPSATSILSFRAPIPNLPIERVFSSVAGFEIDRYAISSDGAIWFHVDTLVNVDQSVTPTLSSLGNWIGLTDSLGQAGFLYIESTVRDNCITTLGGQNNATNEYIHVGTLAEQCGYIPIFYSRTSAFFDNPVADPYKPSYPYSDDIKVRPIPGTTEAEIGVFWGIRIHVGSNYPVDGNGNPITITDISHFRDVRALGAQYGDRTNTGDTSLRVTSNRTFTPLHRYTNANNELWFLIEYEGSLGWVRSDLLNVSNCTQEIPFLEDPNDVRLNLNTFYDALLPVSRGKESFAPNPAYWAPFGECLPYRYSLILQRCAYEVYRDLYQEFEDQNTSLTFGDLVAIIMLGEFGDSINPAQPFANLNQPEKYFVEAAARNLAEVCAYNYEPVQTEAIRCNLRGLMQMLLQVQSFYQTTNVDELLFRNGARFTDFENFVTLIFDDPNWRLGINGSVPLQWGNWLSTNSNNVYTTAENILRGIDVPVNVSPIPDLLWVYVMPNTSPLLMNGTVFAIRNFPSPVDGGCSYTFAITIVNHGLGQTESC